jgi:hypothetical protein
MIEIRENDRRESELHVSIRFEWFDEVDELDDVKML